MEDATGDRLHDWAGVEGRAAFELAHLAVTNGPRHACRTDASPGRLVQGASASGTARSRPAQPGGHVDLAQVTATAAGLVELAAPGGLPTVTARTVERLAADADLRAVLFDGARPLAVSAKTQAADIPGEVRLAVGARDRGCRFPGSTTPLRWADLHHIIPRKQDGDHHPENLTYYARRWHLLVHRHGWEQHLEPQTGQLTISRNGRSWRSLPRGTPLSRPPPPPGEPHQDQQ